MGHTHLPERLGNKDCLDDRVLRKKQGKVLEGITAALSHSSSVCTSRDSSSAISAKKLFLNI